MRKIICNICGKNIQDKCIKSNLITINFGNYVTGEVCSTDCGITLFKRHQVAVACAEERLKKLEKERQ